MTSDEFIETEKIRVLKLYSSKKHHAGFYSKEKFMLWYISQLHNQNFKCFYCDTSILDIRLLILDEKLKTRKTGYGCRGPVLEVDKKQNHLGYSPANCVLACYYCNNDKSYTLDSNSYKRFFGNARKKFFEYLISNK